MLTIVHGRREKVEPSPMMASCSNADIVAQERLVSALRDAAASDAGGGSVAVIETHISHVLLTGQFAYKIKKPVGLGFVDFRTLESRRFYCEEELRLNRRLAPELYLDVVAITGSVAAPTLCGSGPAIEYAVKMREFPQDALASRVLARGELSGALVDALAAQVAGFHRAAAVASAEGRFGAPDTILRLALQNFHQLRPLLANPADIKALAKLAEWTRGQHATCAQAMARRREQGFIRECHGDLHLGNIAILEGKPIIFDCIEFNEEMRWIDVMSEVAFTVMDLKERGRADLAQRFLNAYLEISGDYDGVSVLRFYLVYRAMVRAKVSRLRAGQLPNRDASAALGAEYDGYVRLANSYALSPRPALVITHGLAGSGKTTLSQALLEMIGAVRIRTDVERKRLHGLPAIARDHAGIDAGVYAPEATREAYRRALELARGATAAGYVVIVDATFLSHWQRQLFRDLATESGLPFVIVTFVANEATLRERIVRRLHDASDASDADLAVLEHQLQTQEPLAPDELVDTVAYDAEAALDEAPSRARWRDVLDRLAPERSIS